LIKRITQDQYVNILQTPDNDVCFWQQDATWGLDRISERAIQLDGRYDYSTEGAGVDVYIVDTGIYLQNVEFEGRAKWGKTFTIDGDTDCNGHGTHVAGTVGGKLYGVAKKVTLIAVKVLGCDGSGSWTGVIQGIAWVVNAAAASKKPSAANLSIGGPKNADVDAAVANAVKAGVTMVVAAGNENSDACSFSPAAAKTAITVGATGIADIGNEQLDSRSYFSNYGTCLDIFAPGSLITSAWIGSKTAVNTISGTSMASPHVCGAAALVLGAQPKATPLQVEAVLLAGTNNNGIQLQCGVGTTTCSKSPNRLLYVGCDR